MSFKPIIISYTRFHFFNEQLRFSLYVEEYLNFVKVRRKYFLILQPTVTLTWGNWSDSLAGLQEYKFQIYTVSERNSILTEDVLLKQNGTGIIHLNKTFVILMF